MFLVCTSIELFCIALYSSKDIAIHLEFDNYVRQSASSPRRENDEWRELGNNSASAEAGPREDLKTSPDDQSACFSMHMCIAASQ